MTSTKRTFWAKYRTSGYLSWNVQGKIGKKKEREKRKGNGMISLAVLKAAYAPRSSCFTVTQHTGLHFVWLCVVEVDVIHLDADIMC